ncbi:MAG: 30S ribosomal protein S16 [Rickettsiaceae bacterium]|nr:30S ribosomal protein S16 [Rickettsiaceae bacterium]
MTVKIRLARGGAKKRPFYRVVVADVRAPRDGAFIEKVGTYNPLLKKDNKDRVVLKNERIAYWLEQGAHPTDKIANFIEAAGIKLPEHITKKMAIKVKSRTTKPPKKELKEQKAAEKSQ